jgi:hypothetical protein
VAQEIEVRDGYVAFLFSGVVDPKTAGNSLTERPDVLSYLRRHPFVLFEFSRIEKFGFDAFPLSDAMKNLAAQGVRLAICSTNPEFFGIGRQIAQLSGVEGAHIAVFRAEAEAVGWLVG